MPNYTSGDNSPSSSPILDDGEYEFETVGAKERTSKNENPTIELRHAVSNGNGEIVTLFDYLVFAPKCGWKIDQYRQATGDKLIKGECAFEAEDCIGRRGRLCICIEEYQGKPRNKVDHYVVENGKGKKQAKEDNPF